MEKERIILKFYLVERLYEKGNNTGISVIVQKWIEFQEQQQACAGHCYLSVQDCRLATLTTFSVKLLLA